MDAASQQEEDAASQDQGTAGRPNKDVASRPDEGSAREPSGLRWRSGHAWWEGQGLGGARRHAARTGAWVAMATQAGSTVDEDFPGLAALVASTGEVVARLPDWREGTLIADLPLIV